MTPEINDTLNQLEKSGWTVERELHRHPLEDAILRRYPWIPVDVLDFFCEMKILMSPDEKSWFLTNYDFDGTDDRDFEWNAWEILSLDSARRSRDERWAGEIKEFWDDHLPLLNSVYSGYEYFALDKATKTIVHGIGPDFEEASFLCQNFAELLKLVALKDPGLLPTINLANDPTTSPRASELPPKTPKPAGRWIETPAGYRAFQPSAFALPDSGTDESRAAYAKAKQGLRRLAAEGCRLANARLLVRPFVMREAVFSCRLAGTESTIRELLSADAGITVDRGLEDMRAVRNYASALDYGVKELENSQLSFALIRELHKKLMADLGGAPAAPGEIRQFQNWIGAPRCTVVEATYVPPLADELQGHVGWWEKSIQDQFPQPLSQSAIAHYQFEAIHPFMDGNGRIGRLLIILMLMQRRGLPLPLLNLSPYLEATRQDYFDCLRGVVERSAWDDWLTYYFNAVARQCEDTLNRVSRMDSQIEAWRTQMTEPAAPLTNRLLDMLASNPFLTVRKTVDNLNEGFDAVDDAIRKLAQHGVVHESKGAEGNPFFLSRALLDALEEPSSFD